MLGLKDITKDYPVGEDRVFALKGISIEFRANEFVAILGPSGCGKTTLLNIIGGLDGYTSGDLVVNGRSTKDFQDSDWDTYRNHSVGFVFQSYNLIMHQNVLSNVELALKISGVSKADRRSRAIAALEQVGLGDQLHKKPNMMSGGQMQRVAIARALVNDPDIILADEPTGALDSVTSVQIMDILKEVAADRLVVMVTHNPELAEQYATRTVCLKDGLVLSDSRPVTDGDRKGERPASDRRNRAKLGFATALGLSANNLRTKKGRTLLTAFAGAIGIIGIALILALSNGVQDYIDGIESDTMGSYPIKLEKETVDMGSALRQASESGSTAGLFGSDSGDSSADSLTGITSDNIVAQDLSRSKSTVVKNNLGAFKTYLDENGSQIAGSVSTIEYGYDAVPQVFRTSNSSDGSESIMQVSPSTLQEDESTGKVEISSSSSSSSSSLASAGSSIGSGSISGSISSTWEQLPSSTDQQQRQYSLVAGSWPDAYNEAALVVDADGKVSDYTLYTLGLMDTDHLNAVIDAVENGQDYDDPQQSFSFDDAIGRTFKVFAQSDLYEENADEAGTWVDKGDDQEYLNGIYDSGTDIKITAVLVATDDADVSSGVVYTDGLTKYLMDRAASSAVVQQQLADPSTNVLTGKAFDDSTGSDSTATVQTTSVSSESQASQVSYDIGDGSGDSSTARGGQSSSVSSSSKSTVRTAVYSPSASTASLLYPAADSGTDAQPLPTSYKVVFKNYDGTVLSASSPDYAAGDTVSNAPTQTPTRANDALYSYAFIGWKSSVTHGVYASVDDMPKISDNVVYTAYYYASPLSTSIAAGGYSSGGGDASAASSGLSSGSSPYSGSLSASSTGAEGANASSFSGADASAGASAFSGSATTALSQDQLSVLLAQMSSETPSTYANVLKALGYATEDEPSSIALYPTDFDGKTAIEDFIADYNDQVSDEADSVTYTDMIATMVSSIKSIVNTISYILIAFVAISLIVSSIMIAIITYISVLERTKEIGVLRALGASKGDVSKIFNAETIIEGLCSGLIGVGVTFVLCVPINAIVSRLYNVDGIAVLPAQYGFLLIAVSVVLTMLAGFVPSRIAARKDPVAALRSE